MKFSIIIPCYNVSSNANNLFKMLNNCNYKDYEVIFVDDCSADNTFKKLNEIKKNYNNYIVTKTDKNGGPGVARNRGLDIAKGEYIIFVDSDDKFDINILPIFDKLLTDDVDLVVAPYKIISKCVERKIDCYTKFLQDGSLAINQIVLDEGSMCNKVFKKSIIDEFNIRMPKMISGEDKCFVVKYLSKIKKAIKCDKYYYGYIMNGKSITHNNRQYTDEITSFEILRPIYHESFPSVEKQMYINDYLLAYAKKMFANKTPNKDIKKWFTNANKEYPNWINEIDYDNQGIYRKLIYKAMYKANPYMIKLIMLIRKILY